MAGKGGQFASNNLPLDVDLEKDSLVATEEGPFNKIEIPNTLGWFWAHIELFLHVVYNIALIV